jgi:hypothetical protein
MRRKITIDIEMCREFAKAPSIVDYRIEVTENGEMTSAVYFQHADRKWDWPTLLKKVLEKLPNLCNDFDVTHRRWKKDGTPHTRRMTEWTAYCSHHSVGFPGYHIGYTKYKGKKERLFECSYCGCTFPESRGMECDRR